MFNVMDLICECFHTAMSTPSAEQLIDQLSSLQTCTVTQCFESVDDIIPPASNHTSPSLLPLALVVVSYVALYYNRPPTLLPPKPDYDRVNR